MALNIKDPETERLAAEVATLTGESKTAAVRAALRTRRDQVLADRESVQERVSTVSGGGDPVSASR
jgi:antitoxin VapB